LNAQNPVQIKIVSSAPAIAVAEGADASGVLTLNFPAGSTNVAAFKVKGLALGGADLSVEGDIASGTPLTAAAPEPSGGPKPSGSTTR